VLLSLVQSGRLPWSDCPIDAECRALKEACNITEFAESLGCPEVGYYSLFAIFALAEHPRNRLAT
jgi:hypothetical protein